MSSEAASDNISPDAVEVIQAAFQEWQSGNQPAALARVRERADKDEIWAVVFMVWLYVQQGIPGFGEAIPYARRALALGAPWAVTTLVNNIFPNLQNAPQLFEPATELLTMAYPSPPLGIDPLGHAWNLLAQGRPADAMKLMSIPVMPPPLATWEGLLAHAREQDQTVTEIAASLAGRAQEFDATANESIDAIAKARADVETAASQAGLLFSSLNAAAVNSLFDAEADRNASESRTSWRWGIAVLAAAACIAILPLVLHYLDQGPDYSSGALLGAHAGSTAALGAVAGVLLSRARARDHARQRARDLSTAMGTMISYSNQIQDEAEKQRFMLTMGQLVLQAHLHGDTSASGREDSLTGLAALLSVMRQANTPNP